MPLAFRLVAPFRRYWAAAMLSVAGSVLPLTALARLGFCATACWIDWLYVPSDIWNGPLIVPDPATFWQLLSIGQTPESTVGFTPICVAYCDACCPQGCAAITSVPPVEAGMMLEFTPLPELPTTTLADAAALLSQAVDVRGVWLRPAASTSSYWQRRSCSRCVSSFRCCAP